MKKWSVRLSVVVLSLALLLVPFMHFVPKMVA